MGQRAREVAVDVTEECAYVGPLGALCDSPPAWTIVTAEAPYELVDACSLHVGELLVAGTLNYVWAAVSEASMLWPCRSCGTQTRPADVDCWEPSGGYPRAGVLCLDCSRADG